MSKSRARKSAAFSQRKEPATSARTEALAEATGGPLRASMSPALGGSQLSQQLQAYSPQAGGPAVQLRGKGRRKSAGELRATAAEGVAGGGGKMPHHDAIQKSFGKHDIGSVQAHVGGKAGAAAESIGAQAYATGDQVAFQASPDLHTAAHEAAHVVQQRGGVQLKGGVGQRGDAYERNADAVADAVVQGKSAEGLLGGPSGGGPSGVQRRISSGWELQCSGSQDEESDKAFLAIAEERIRDGNLVGREDGQAHALLSKEIVSDLDFELLAAANEQLGSSGKPAGGALALVRQAMLECLVREVGVKYSPEPCSMAADNPAGWNAKNKVIKVYPIAFARDTRFLRIYLDHEIVHSKQVGIETAAERELLAFIDDISRCTDDISRTNAYGLNEDELAEHIAERQEKLVKEFGMLSPEKQKEYENDPLVKAALAQAR